MSNADLPAVPAGFRLAGVHCGIKQDPDKEDLLLIICDGDAVASGVYTQNVVHSAAVATNRQKTPGAGFRAVVANSGNANTCTGQRGWEDTLEMAKCAAAACGALPEQTLVMSTGVIGAYLPMGCVVSGIAAANERLGDDREALLSAARAMLTTDKFQKIAGRTIDFADSHVQVTGMAKGAGMIAPNMATMLAVILTDAALSPQQAQRVLSDAVEVSFNCISVDGHMSTSDTVLLLASGDMDKRPLSDEDLASLAVAVSEVCVELAKMIPDDGEGASHRIIIDVKGCATRVDAHRIAKTIAESPLVKTGIAGADPNWGRIVSAAGYAGVRFDPNQLSLQINGTPVYQQGVPVEFNAAQLSVSIRDHRDTSLVLTLAEGDARIRFWTSDLTLEYVRFNSEYTT